MLKHKTILTILSILLLSACLLNAQPDAPYEPDPITAGLWHMDNSEPESLWTVTIGDEDEITNLGSVTETGDGAYFIGGSSIVDTTESMLLMEIDEDGETNWLRRYDGLAFCRDLVVVGDTSLAILTYGDGANDYYVLITDLDGDSLTCYSNDTEDDGVFTSILKADDGFILAGCTVDTSFTAENMWIIKLDSDGQFSWSETYDCDGSQYNSCSGILSKLNGTYLLHGISEYDGYIIEIDSDGEIVWERRYENNNSCWIRSMIKDGEYYHCIGTVYNSQNHHLLRNYWLLTIDENGNERNSGTFGSENNDIGNSIIKSFDGKIVFAGVDNYQYDDDYYRINGNMGLVKTDMEGEVIWHKAFGDDSHEEAQQVFQCSDNSYLLFGTTTDDDQNSRIRIIRTTPDLDMSADVSGNMNRGEIFGDATQSDNGRWGETLDLTSERSGCMLVENDQSLQPDILTVECWFRLSLDRDHTGALVYKTLDNEFASYALFASNENEEVVFLIGTEAHEFALRYETNPGNNRWHHIAGSFDNRRMKLYYDGRLAGELDVREAIYYDNGPLLIGSDDAEGHGDYQFYGKIDEVRISDYPREFSGIEQYSDAQLPNEFGILNVYPNPFNSTAIIDFNLLIDNHTSLTVMDCSGRVVKNLFEDKLPAGKHRYELKSIDKPAGLYLVQLRSGAEMSVRKVVFLK